MPGDPELEAPGGVFVTLKDRGRLAGCIGFVGSAAPLWRTTEEAARGAALDDPRFDRIPSDRLDGVEVEISVLSPPVPIDAEDVVVGRHGLLLERSPWERGLLLPQVAVEHGLDRLGFLRALCRKAGVEDQAWDDPRCLLRAFTVQKAAGALLPLCREED
jgi:AmmeMemoRadiSam system protein A